MHRRTGSLILCKSRCYSKFTKYYLANLQNITHMENKFGFVYLWFDRKRRKFCIGSHLGPEGDNYISSTGWMKFAYLKRPEDFKRRILKRTYNGNKELKKAEQHYLNMIKDEELGVKYYNLKKIASGGNGHANKGKRHVAWNKGITKEMQLLRKAKLFCLLQDKPKIKKNKSIHKQSIVPSKSPKRVAWNKGKKMDVNFGRCISSRMLGKTAWNKGIPNPRSAELGKRTAAKQRKTVTGRKLALGVDGKKHWVYPKNDRPLDDKAAINSSLS